MSVTQFAMVEELAFLIKDNLPCKHLVLSMEETLVNILQDDASSSGVLELEPMNSYNRLLLHRLADIFGFSHQSVGEGDDRHLILECCAETSIPPILVGDLLWQYDGFETSTSHQLLRRKEISPVPPQVDRRPTLQYSLEEREEAYSAARERIFSLGRRLGETEEEPPLPVLGQKPPTRNVPVVARRMIAHALGQRINHHQSNQQQLSVSSSDNYSSSANEEFVKKNCEINIILEKKGEDGGGDVSCLQTSSSSSSMQPRRRRSNNDVLSGNNKPPNVILCEFTTSASRAATTGQKVVDSKLPSSRTTGISRTGRNETSPCVLQGNNNLNLKEEHIGAAKRIFAHALGIHPSSKAAGGNNSPSKCSSSSSSSNSSETKQTKG